MFAATLPAQARAAGGTHVVPSCHAYSDTAQSASTSHIPAREWLCNPSDWASDRTVTWLRFDASNWADTPAPRFLVTRITKFRSISIARVTASGELNWREFKPEQASALAQGPTLILPLPEADAETTAIIVGFDKAWASPVLFEAYLSDEPADPNWDATDLLLFMMICGILLVPLIYNLIFFRILREGFTLWHAAFVAAMIAHLFALSGLAVYFFEAGVPFLAIFNPLSFAFTIAAGIFFSEAFLERDVLSEGWRRSLRAAGLWILVTSVPLSFQPDFLHGVATDYFYYSFIPTAVIFVTTLIMAWRAGSRAARYQIAAWTPFIIACIWRFLYGVGWIDSGHEIEHLLFYSFAFEVLVTSIGVADRFMTIKLQRDKAQSDAQLLEHLYERDTLTDLYNRRVLEDRFEDLRSDGYTVMALLDIDYFKSVNDTFGHGVGDDVLRAVAKAISTDDNTVVVRMGGEEFAILLRGRNAFARAEHLRGSIPRRVAAEVQLDRVITASMGVIDIPVGALPEAGLEIIYRRADRLLYEAKGAGRNRMMSEKLQVFSAPAKRGRRKDVA